MSAYFIFHNRVRDRAKLEEYIPKALATLAPHDAEIVVFDEQTSVVEGTVDLPRTIVVRFKSRADALAWYESPEYRAVLPLRLDATEGVAMLVDGYEGSR